MKLYLIGLSLLSLFVLSPAPSKAQGLESAPNLSLSATAGLGMSRITQDAFDNALTYGFGVGAKYYFLDFLGLGTGLEYEARKLGTKSTVSNLEDGTANYLDFPLLLAFRFGGMEHQGSFDVGGLYAVSLSDKVGDGSGAFIQAENSLGFTMRAGYNYFLPSNLGIGVEGSMKYLPAGALKLGIGNVTDDNDQHFISLGLNLKLSYGLVI